MTEKYQGKNEEIQEFDPIGSFLLGWSDSEEEDISSEFFQGLAGRRRKALLTLMSVWGIVIFLHLVTWGYWITISLTAIVSLYIFRLLFARSQILPQPLTDLESAPIVSLLVSAKNEEAVIGNLMSMLCNLNYPQDKYEVWAIDDRSTDKTPEILDKLVTQYPQLRVIHRTANAGGGKSGALNQVLPYTKGEIIGVFDADARVDRDLLLKIVPMFDPEDIGAVQVRKSIANSSENFWTKGQSAEMLLDSYLQQKRIAIDGIGELRGNGQFVRREALISCGSWNEETITDDLDLTIRLHLDNWKIGFLFNPAVEEEGVTKASALWHQRNRWAEGGYQRYLDYWRYIFSRPMGFRKRLDLVCFVLLQYILPTATLPDVMMMLVRRGFPLLSPLSIVLLALGFIGMSRELTRISAIEGKLGLLDLLKISWQTIQGMIYMLHWQIVIPSITARMSVRQKKLKWVKTVHEGSGNEQPTII